MKALNKSQVTALFEREAILMGTEDRVPEQRAIALFSKDAVEHARIMDRVCPGRYMNGYGAGDYVLPTLTYRGFQAAASFCNVQAIRNEAEIRSTREWEKESIIRMLDCLDDRKMEDTYHLLLHLSADSEPKGEENIEE